MTILLTYLKNGVSFLRIVALKDVPEIGTFDSILQNFQQICYIHYNNGILYVIFKMCHLLLKNNGERTYLPIYREMDPLKT